MENISFAALLPMKGHSERVKNKNIRNFAGKPLFTYVLDTLRKCKYVTDVYVDTDSKEIVQLIGRYYEDVQIIERPERLCGDMVSMNDIIKYDIAQIGAKYYLQTHATNPLLKSDTLDAACVMFIEGMDRYDSAFSVNKLQTRLYNADGSVVNHNPDILQRTQDLSPLYEENSNFYIFSTESFQRRNARIGEKPMMMEMSKLESVDIDEEQDFILAEQLYQAFYLGMKGRGE